MSIRDQILDECLECSACVQVCEFMKLFCESPVELAQMLSDDIEESNAYIPYLCNLCGLCKVNCPVVLDCGAMFLEARKMLVEKGFGPLPAHEPVVTEIKRVRSDAFTISFPDPATKQCSQVFLPGCHLSEYSPDLVMSAYEWLRENYPDTGFMLRCCGAPTRSMGKTNELEEMGDELIAEVKRMGAKRIIVACPNCRATIKAYAGDIEVKTIYEVMAENDAILPTGAGQVFALHDPCAGRWDTNTHTAVRNLLKKAGFTLEEFTNHGQQTSCCGMGGMVGYVSFDVSDAVKGKRLAETKSDIVTYCASCREAFADQRPTLHILDLIFNANWENDKVKKPNDKARQQDNTVVLKRTLEKKYNL